MLEVAAVLGLNAIKVGRERCSCAGRSGQRSHTPGRFKVELLVVEEALRLFKRTLISNTKAVSRGYQEASGEGECLMAEASPGDTALFLPVGLYRRGRRGGDGQQIEGRWRGW